jgi:hypothetical protein
MTGIMPSLSLPAVAGIFPQGKKEKRQFETYP